MSSILGAGPTVTVAPTAGLSAKTLLLYGGLAVAAWFIVRKFKRKL